MMKVNDFIQKAKDVATKYKTLYVMGCFGSPMSSTNKTRYCNNNPYNKRPNRTAKIKSVSSDTFGFDCVCLIKGILWGWNGNKNKTYGGANYGSNGVPDVGADGMMNNCCTGVSSNFSNIIPGELVWLKGHIGIYIGNGLVVESTPIWKDGVQITALKNLGIKSGYNNRTWTKHGKCKYIDYSGGSKETPKPSNNGKKSVTELAKEVIDGKWGSGEDRKKKLEKAGYNYREVQNKVNELLKSPNKTKYTPKVGDIVVPINLVDYRGKKVHKYDSKYEILEINKNGALLGAIRGKQRPIWATIKLDNLKKV